MKKILLAVCWMTVIGFTDAQNLIPNTGFETWNVNPNYDDPAGWGTINGLTYFLGVRTVTKATAAQDIHGGSYAIKLETKDVPLNGHAPGIAATGTINTSGYVDGGLSYNKRPISFSGWYKYTSGGGTDTALIEATLSRWNSNTHQREEVGKATFNQHTNVSSYTNFSVNFTYSSAATPDTLVVILLTSNLSSNFPLGSILFVDDLSLELCTGFTATASAGSAATCTAANGSATVATTAGTGTLSYHWSNNASTSSITAAAGAYTVTVSDANGCSVTSAATISGTSISLNLTPSANAATCTANNGSASVAVSNGTASYTYSWSNGGNSNSIANVVAGNYTVTVNDANGCSGTSSATVNSTTVPITVNTSATATACGANTGTAIAATNSGTQPYTYFWSNSGTNDTITDLGAGNYNVTISDANGCTGTGTAAVTTPNGPSATDSTTNVTCSGGTNGAVNVTVSGGTPNITYLWNNSATSEDLTGVGAGIYTLTVTDANSCSFLVTANVTEPAVLTATTSHTNVSCHGADDGTVTITVAGGTAPYSYFGNPVPGGTTTFPNLAAGSYVGNLVDTNGCSAAVSETITEPDSLVIQATVVDASSASANDGSVTITASGGTPLYSFNWTPNVSTTANATALAVGIYCVTVSDNNACVATRCVSVTAPSAVSVVAEESFQLYPNPSNGNLIIETTTTNTDFSFAVFTLEGKLVAERIIRETKTMVDVSSLSAGFYTCALKNNLTGKIDYGKIEIAK